MDILLEIRGIPRKMHGKVYGKHWYRLCISYPLGRSKGGGWTESIPFQGMQWTPHPWTHGIVPCRYTIKSLPHCNGWQLFIRGTFLYVGMGRGKVQHNMSAIMKFFRVRQSPNDAVHRSQWKWQATDELCSKSWHSYWRSFRLKWELSDTSKTVRIFRSWRRVLWRRNSLHSAKHYIDENPPF